MNSVNKNLVVAALLLPGIGYLTLFFGIPVSWSFWGSLQSSGEGIISLEHYSAIFTNKLYRDGLFFTLYLSLVPLVTGLLISIPLAALLQKNFYGKQLFMVLYKIPLVVPSIVAALMIMLMIDRGGMAHRVGDMAGITSWPRMVRDPWAIGVIVTRTWKSIPFMTLIIGGSMASINTEVLHAARMLGAKAWQVFFKIQIPLALPGITAATLLTFIGSMGGFAVPNLLGPIYPIPLSVHMYGLMTQGEWSQVFAIGSLLSAVSIVVLLTYYRITHKAHQALLAGR